MMTEDEVLNLVSRRITAAHGLTDDEKLQAVNYYLCRPRGDELVGRSQVQSADVADMVEAVLAQILPSFTGDRVCEFEPEGEGDEIQARLETEATNKVMMEASRGFIVFYEAIKDALMLKNGIIKVWAEEEDQEQTNEYENLSPDQRASLLQAQEGEELDWEAIPNGLRVTRRRTRRKVKMAAVDPCNFLVEDSAQSILLTDCRGTYERKELTRGELLEAGYVRADIDELPLFAGSTIADIRKKQGSRLAQTTGDWSSELVEVWDCYVALDRDDDGISERLRILCGLNTAVLEITETEDLCYAAGSPWLQPHQWKGLSLFDKEKGVQDVKTATLRRAIDNLGDTRTFVNTQVVNIDDMLTSRPNGIVQVNGPVDGNILPQPALDQISSAQGLLTYMDKIRSERGGAALEMQSGEPGVLTSQIGVQNVADVLTNVELLANMISKTLAETLIRSTFVLVHRVLRTESTEPMTLRQADKWVTVDPRQWKARDRVNIKAGLSPGERRRKAANFEKIVAHQMSLIQSGMDGVLVTLPNIYSAMQDWCAASDVDAGEKYFTNPAGDSSKQAGQMKQQQAQQMQMVQLQLEQGKLQMERMKIQMDKYKADLDARVSLQIEALRAEVEEAKIVGAATADLQVAELQARAGPAPVAQRAA